MDLPDEIKANEAHLKRLRDDPEYAFQFAKDGIYGDLGEFKEFLEAYGMIDIIARELLRALCNSEMASKKTVDLENHDRTVSQAINYNAPILRARLAVLDAVSNIKCDLDAKIKWDMEQKR